MGIYYFLLWIGVIGTFLSQDSRLKRTGFYIIFIYILALFVMVVFRYDVGTDYLEYTDYYYRIHSLFELTSEDFFVEPGYVLLSSLLRSIGAPFELLSFILFLIIVCNLKRAIAFFSDNIPLSVVLYVFLFFLSFHFNLIRHGVMVSFVWKGYSWWFVGKKKRAFISLVCGAMFHALSLCFLSLLFIHLRKYPIYIYAGVLVFSFIISAHPDWLLSLFDTLLSSIIGTDNRLFFYLNGGHSGVLNETGVTIGMFFNLTLFCVSYFLLIDKKSIFLYNILFIGITFFLLFNSFGAISERIASTCYVANIFILPSVLNLMYVNKWRFLCLAVILLYGILMFNKEVSKESANYIPFTAIFSM